MKTFKVMTIVGTRPEIIRLSRVMARLDETTNHIIVHTGQNYDYELNEIFFKDLEVRKPDIFLDAAAGTPIHTIAGILKGIDTVLDEQMPDAFLIQIAAWRPFRQKEKKYLFSTWKPAIGVLISVYLKR